MTKAEAVLNLIAEGSNKRYTRTATLRAVASLRALGISGSSAADVLRFLELIDVCGRARPADSAECVAKVAELIAQ